MKSNRFAKTGSGQTCGKLKNKTRLFVFFRRETREESTESDPKDSGDAADESSTDKNTNADDATAEDGEKKELTAKDLAKMQNDMAAALIQDAGAQNAFL